MTTAILQARTSSSRLPGKVLMPILGMPMVLRQIERLKYSTKIDQIVLATSIDKSDDDLAHVVESSGIPVVRGQLNDVFSRYELAITQFNDSNYVRLTADCPLADALVIDSAIEKHINSGSDYTSNAHPRSFPRGLDVEVFTQEAFSTLCEFELDYQEQEHVTMGFYRRPKIFNISNLEQVPNYASQRWTVDYKEDFDFVARIYEELFSPEEPFWQQEILNLLFAKPELIRLESDAEGH